MDNEADRNDDRKAEYGVRQELETVGRDTDKINRGTNAEALAVLSKETAEDRHEVVSKWLENHPRGKSTTNDGQPKEIIDDQMYFLINNHCEECPGCMEEFAKITQAVLDKNEQ
jgi:hypothetical protein